MTRDHRIRTIAFGIAVALLPPARAAAQLATVGITVDRDAGAEVCPDRIAVEKELHTLFPEMAPRFTLDPADAALRAVIAIRRTSAGYEAIVQFSGMRSGQRQLLDHSDDCGGLAKALSVAVVLMAEAAPEPASLEPQPALPPAGQQKPPSTVMPARRAEEQSVSVPSDRADNRGDTRALVEPAPLEVGALAGVGMFRTPGYGGYLGAGLVVARRFEVRLRGLAMTSHSESGGGAVDVSLYGGLLAGCWRVQAAQWLWFTPCVEAGLGRQRGVADGYDQNWSVSSPWRAAGVGLGAEVEPLQWFRLMLGAGLLAAVHRQTFSVLEVGPVQKQPPAGLYAWLGAGFPMFRNENRATR